MINAASLAGEFDRRVTLLGTITTATTNVPALIRLRAAQ